MDIDRENAKSFIKRINNSVKINSSQIDDWENYKENFLKTFGIGNGLITGLIISLLNSDIPKNLFLFFLGLGLLLLAEFIWIFHSRKFLLISKPYVKHLMYINKKMSYFSSLYNKFLRGDWSWTYEQIKNNFLSDENYKDMHDDASFDKINEWKIKEIENDAKINTLTFCFIMGLIFIFVSLVYPHLTIFMTNQDKNNQPASSAGRIIIYNIADGETKIEARVEGE